MRRPRRLKRLWRIGFPLCGWLSLALFLLAACGVSLPMPLAKDLSQPFPCMLRQCGCQSAEQCWKSCCCHSASERLAWAKAHGVQPPAELAAAAAIESTRDCQSASCGPKSASCEAEPCSSSARPSPNACCEMKQRRQFSHDAEPTEVVHNSGLSIIAALQCGGNYHGVAAMPVALPLATFDWQPMVRCLELVAAATPRESNHRHSPPVPPPRTHC